MENVRVGRTREVGETAGFDGRGGGNEGGDRKDEEGGAHLGWVGMRGGEEWSGYE